MPDRYKGQPLKANATRAQLLSTGSTGRHGQRSQRCRDFSDFSVGSGGHKALQTNCHGRINKGVLAASNAKRARGEFQWAAAELANRTRFMPQLNSYPLQMFPSLRRERLRGTPISQDLRCRRWIQDRKVASADAFHVYEKLARGASQNRDPPCLVRRLQRRAR
jgi:hypothetical protein